MSEPELKRVKRFSTNDVRKQIFRILKITIIIFGMFYLLEIVSVHFMLCAK